MRLMKKRILSFLLGMFCLQTYAAFPVIDIKGILESISQFNQEMRNFQMEYTNSISMLDEFSNLHKKTSEQYAKLKKISNQFGKYYKIAEATKSLIDLTNFYARSYPKFTSSSLLSIVEKKRFLGAYKAVLKNGSIHIKNLKDIVSNDFYEMSEGERMDKIDAVHREIVSLRNEMVRINRLVYATIENRASRQLTNNTITRMLGNSFSFN